jgi:hypothetical protein
MASRQRPNPPDGLRAVQRGQFLVKKAIFNHQTGLKPLSNKRKSLLFFTIVL